MNNKNHVVKKRTFGGVSHHDELIPKTRTLEIVKKPDYCIHGPKPWETAIIEHAIEGFSCLVANMMMLDTNFR